MDCISVGVVSERDDEIVLKAMSEVGLAEPTTEINKDPEIRDGLERFCLLKSIKKMRFLAKSRS